MPNFERNLLIFSVNPGSNDNFLRQYVAENFSDCGLYILRSEKTDGNPQDLSASLIFNDYRHPTFGCILKAHPQNLDFLVKSLNITEIFVNNLIYFNFLFIANWILTSKLPFTLMFHNYYCVCANEHFQYCESKFCELSEIHPVCRKKLKNFHLEDWRKCWSTLLRAAKKIIAPSSYTAQIIKNIYPNLNIEVRPHKISLPIERTFKTNFAAREKLRITFLGQLYEHKGEWYLLKLNEIVRREKLPIEFVVLGEYKDDVRAGTREGIILAGKYNAPEVSKKLAEYETAIVATLSKVPETYCYTASEAMLSGYPVMAMNVGAHALRVAKNKCGWIFPIEAANHGLDNLINFCRLIVTPAGRNEILIRAANTANFKNGTE